uniref:Uncharacterized protein n=1 Tax=Lutzomyia longipalpis TaxID=7200 RepID=A0A1B0CAZ6_LUTLO
MIESNSCLPIGCHLLHLPAPIVNDKLPLEVRHELEVLLLLMNPHHFELLPKHRLELLLERESEREPTHIAGIASLPKVHNTLNLILRRWHILRNSIIILISGYAVATEEDVALLRVEVPQFLLWQPDEFLIFQHK